MLSATDDLVFGFEVVEEGAPGDADAFADFFNGDSIHAAFQEHRCGGIFDAQASFLAVAFPQSELLLISHVR